MQTTTKPTKARGNLPNTMTDEPTFEKVLSIPQEMFAP